MVDALFLLAVNGSPINGLGILNNGIDFLVAQRDTWRDTNLSPSFIKTNIYNNVYYPIYKSKICVFFDKNARNNYNQSDPSLTSIRPMRSECGQIW